MEHPEVEIQVSVGKDGIYYGSCFSKTAPPQKTTTAQTSDRTYSQTLVSDKNVLANLIISSFNVNWKGCSH